MKHFLPILVTVSVCFLLGIAEGVRHANNRPKEQAPAPPPSRFIVTEQDTSVTMFLILDTKTGREYLRTETGTVALEVAQ
jgi:hypothetical protein